MFALRETGGAHPPASGTVVIMRVLVLGGTVFLGHAVAAEAVARGHRVTCAARGKSGPVPAGAELVRVDRSVGLAPLAGRAFDAVIDLAPMSHPWVADALAALGGEAGHWTFVSTVNVYADHARPGQRPGDPTLAPLAAGELSGDRDPERYGAIKVASEDAVRAAVGDRAFVVRPGLITGPGDTSDRFGYWPARFASDGPVLVPDVPDQPIQHIDVRDLAAWIVGAGERGLTGTFDGVGPAEPLGEFLRGIAAAVGADLEWAPADPAALAAAGVGYWAGPRSLPLWLPESHRGMAAHDAAPSLAAGLAPRPVAETAVAALAHERALGLDRERRAGLSRAEEVALLAALG